MTPSVALAQVPLGPVVSIVQGLPAAPTIGSAVFVLAADPSQHWQLVNGAWVQFISPPGELPIGLVDSGDDLQLEDGGGPLLRED